MKKQTTLKQSFTLSGRGLHTGLDVVAVFEPAPEDSGYKIQRVDLVGNPVINATANNVIDTTRSTVLGKEDIRVSTVEHALAALFALGVDNCTIKVNGPELPILDGSSIQYVEKIKEVGIEEQSAYKDSFIVKKKLEVRDEQTGSCITVWPAEEFSITVLCDYDSKFINNQYATLENIDSFTEEIAPARTFVFMREVERLHQVGLAKGGNLDNAIVIYEKEMPQEKLDSFADLLNVKHHDAKCFGYLQHKPLIWANECARHKLLDMIGDIALVGKSIKGHIVANCPGHKINNKFSKLICKEIREYSIRAPHFDPNVKPVMDVMRIRELIPHRYPMHLVDRVIEMSATTIVGLKNVTINEAFFQGHFPQEPIMPGVLQVEAMAQCGGLLVLSRLNEPEKYSTYFLKIDNVKFRKKVTPGDILLLKVSLLASVKHGISSMKGLAFVGEKLVAEASFTAQIVKNR